MEEVKEAIGFKEITINGKQYKIVPETGQIVEYLSKLEEYRNGKKGNLIKEQVEFAKSVLVNGGNGLTPTEAQLLVETNLQEAIFGVHVAFGLADKNALEAELKKKIN